MKEIQSYFQKRKTLDIALLSAGLLVICGLAYGLTASKLGFFLDDWYIIWTYRTFGTGKFFEFFMRDRPLFSYIYRIFIPIFKDSPLGWQLFAIFTKWLSAITLWALLNLLLHKRKWFNYAVATLFAVYPGFKFHYFVVMYSQNYALFAIYLLSYILMILALRNPKMRILFTAAAMICQFLGIAPMEYYYGLELVRPVIVYLAMSKEQKNFVAGLIRALKFSLPYVLVLFGFTAFRVLRRDLYGYQIGFLEQFKTAPLESVKDLLLRLAQGLFDSCVTVWIELLKNLSNTEGLLKLLPRLGVVVAAFALSLLLISRSGSGELKSDGNKKESLLLIGLGLYAVLVGMIPFLIAGFSVGVLFHNNRFLLTLSIGVCLLVVSVVDFLLRNKPVKWVVIALVIGLSVEADHLNGLTFQKAWEDQTNFFAQLTWRIPQLERGTVVITPDVSFEQYFSGTSLTAPLNMIYAPDLRDNPIPYQMMLAGSIQMNSMPELLPNQPINRASRVFRFIGNTSNMVTVYMPSQGCLKVIPPDTNSKSFGAIGRMDLWKKLIPLSNLLRIDTEAANAELPHEFFGEVSTETWCYYYQRAALEEQRNQWSEVVAHYKMAEAKGFGPANSSEWLPLINAIHKLNDASSALEMSANLGIDDDFTVQGLCSIWQNNELALTTDENEKLVNLLAEWQCDGK